MRTHNTRRRKMKYGNAPELHGIWDLEFEQYMHYMYLPVEIPEDSRHWFTLPPELEFARELVGYAWASEVKRGNLWSHVYVTARRGFATPGNPLNRPGWHSDGFGTPDINYVWTDRYPTHFAIGDFGEVSEDHVESTAQFEGAVAFSDDIRIRTYPDKTLMRLDPSVIHTAPPIPAPGGERSFFKVSFSNTRYNLKGNAHNYMLKYDWPMYDRAAVRNDPSRAQDDTVEEEK
ncbi:hypothetical protein SEA_LYELL_82 [Microbacterium phage Lyell]|nr:hypothetical protein SEA_LYELL_82 [Microbacterium phage Lyell]